MSEQYLQIVHKYLPTIYFHFTVQNFCRFIHPSVTSADDTTVLLLFNNHFQLDRLYSVKLDGKFLMTSE